MRKRESRLDLLRNYPFQRLAALLDGIEPVKSPIMMQIGEPQGAVPSMVLQVVATNTVLFGKYPRRPGHRAYNEAAARWLERRYGLPENSIDAPTQVTAVCGTREGLFQAALMAVMRKRERLANQDETPAVLLSNPMYHVYFGAAVAGGADPVLVPATADNAFVLDFANLSEDVLARTALCFLCSPGNPTGAVASQDEIVRMLKLARQHDFILAMDECYSEIWFDRPPASGFDAAAALGDSPDHLLVFNSLSKRSGTPGLRCGFVAGDPDLMAPFMMLRSYGGAQLPGPLMAAGEALWRDEIHAAENRRRYHTLAEIADDHLKDVPGYRRSEAGFFLWMETSKTVGPGEEAARQLWEKAGVKVLPGRYMAQPENDGKTTPGDDFVRIALVHDPDTVSEAVERIETVLNGR